MEQEHRLLACYPRRHRYVLPRVSTLPAAVANYRPRSFLASAAPGRPTPGAANTKASAGASPFGPGIPAKTHPRAGKNEPCPRAHATLGENEGLEPAPSGPDRVYGTSPGRRAKLPCRAVCQIL